MPSELQRFQALPMLVRARTYIKCQHPSQALCSGNFGLPCFLFFLCGCCVPAGCEACTVITPRSTSAALLGCVGRALRAAVNWACCHAGDA